MTEYHWTEMSTEIASLATHADALELAGCVDLGDAIEQVHDGSIPHFYSVYFHFSPEWGNDPQGLHGCMCIADRPDVESAKAFADELAAQYGLPIHSFIRENSK